MYLDLYKGLNLKPEDLTAYESPLVSFEGKTVIPKCQIKLPIQTDSEIVEVDFIVVNSYSPLYSHCGHALAPCPKDCFFYTASKGEVPL